MNIKFLKQLLVIVFAISIFAACTKDEPVVIDNQDTKEENLLNEQSTMLTLFKADLEVKNDFESEESSRRMCFEINFPLEIIYPDKSTTTANSFSALEKAFNVWYEENKGSKEEPALNYPIEVTLMDGTIESLTDDSTLLALTMECLENENVVERKCFEINYPVQVKIESQDAPVTLNNREEFENLSKSKDDAVKHEFVYPISVTLKKGDVKTLQSNEDFKALKEYCGKKGEEDDKDHFNDAEFNFTIIDNNCFELAFPVELLLPDASKTVINNTREFYAIIVHHRNNGEEDAKIELSYPVNVVLYKDKSEIEITSQEDLKGLFAECKENWDGFDDDKDEDWGGFDDDDRHPGLHKDFDFVAFGKDCFEIAFPVELILGGESRSINSEDEFVEVLQTHRENSNNPPPKLYLDYPVNVVLFKSNEVIQLNSSNELEDLFRKCKEDRGDFNNDDKDEGWHNDFDFSVFRNNCFEMSFPVELVLDNEKISINNPDELSETLRGYRENNNHAPKIALSFPINVVLLNGNESVQLNSQDDIRGLLRECREGFGGFNNDDRDEIDWEEIHESFEFEFLRNQCFQIEFPVSFSIQDGSLVSADSYEGIIGIFVEETQINNGDFPELNLAYPVTVTLHTDRSSIAINSEEEFEKLYEECELKWEEDNWEDVDWEEVDIVANQLQEILRNDCYKVQLPISITTEADDVIEFDSFEDIIETLIELHRNNEIDFEEVALNYPISVVSEDGVIEEIKSEEDFEKLFEDCEEVREENWDNYDDFDWENIDFDWGDFDFSMISFDEFDLTQLGAIDFEGLSNFEIFCFEINFPVSINVTDEERITAENYGDLFQQMFEVILNNRGENTEPKINYPITVTIEDGNTRTVNSDDEFEELVKNCFD